MFTVIITEKGGEQRRLDFDKPEVTIGRVQGNDIILPKGNVSKRHSRIVLKDGKFIIVDLKSTNGTYVNGRKITSPLVLKETDKIYIGDFIITVEEGGAADNPVAGLAASHTGSMTPIPPPAIPSGVYEPAPPSGTPSLIANPPPAPKRPPAPPPAPPPRRPPVDEDVDLDDGLEIDAPSAPAPMPVRPAPAPTAPPTQPPPVAVPAPRAAPASPMQTQPPARDAIAARAQAVGAAVGGGVGRTTNREEAIHAMPVHSSAHSSQAPQPTPSIKKPPSQPMPIAPAPQPTARVAPAAPPVALHGAAAAERERPMPRSTLKSFDAVVPPAETAASHAPDATTARRVEVLRDLVDRAAAQLDLARLPVERHGDEAIWQRAESALADLAEQMEADGALPGGLDQNALVKDALNDLLGAGPLEDLLADDAVTAVLVDRADRVLVERAGRVTPSGRVFSSENALKQAIERLAVSAGRRLEAGAALVDARLPGGVRLTAVLRPLAVSGPCLTLRKPRRASEGLDELVRAGMMNAQIATFLGTCSSARRNVLVAGGPLSGKSTLLGALAGLVPGGERVVSVEEVAELPGGEGRVALEARPAEDGRPAVGFVDVVRAALRMRPDRLIVGEIRGAEALEVLAAMASGDGAFASVAGDSVSAALARLETLARLAAPDASPRGLRELVVGAAGIVVHVGRYADGVRRVTSVAEVTGLQADGYAIRELFSFQVQGHGADGIRGRFAGAGVVPKFYEQLEARGEKADPALFR